MVIATTGFAHNVAVYARRLGMPELGAERIERMAVATERHSLSQDSRSGAVFAVVGTHLHATHQTLSLRDVVTVSRLVSGAYWYYKHEATAEAQVPEYCVQRSVRDLVAVGWTEVEPLSALAQTYAAFLIEGHKRDVSCNASQLNSPLTHAILSKIPGYAQVQQHNDSEDNYF